MAEERENRLEWNRFERLGEMISDGDHEDMASLNREYKKLAKILIPEIAEQDKEQKKLKAIRRNAQMEKLLENKSCSCGGKLKQSRSGSKIAYCETCGARFKAVCKK